MSDATSPRWVVHKFGGTSLASAERYRNVANILRDRDEKPCAVVVSAMGGLTDMLVGLVEGGSYPQLTAVSYRAYPYLIAQPDTSQPRALRPSFPARPRADQETHG